MLITFPYVLGLDVVMVETWGLGIVLPSSLSPSFYPPYGIRATDDMLKVIADSKLSFHLDILVIHV